MHELGHPGDIEKPGGTGRNVVDLPDVPTIAESGMPGFEVISWQGVCTPKGVPKTALARVRETLGAALALPETRVTKFTAAD